MAALLGGYTGVVRWFGIPGVAWIVDLLIGVLIFTRIGLIAGHLANLWLFNRVARDPDALQGSLRYARSVTHGVSAARFFSYAALVAAGALAVPTSGFLWGGALGLAMMGVWQVRLSRRAARARATQPQPQG